MPRRVRASSHGEVLRHPTATRLWIKNTAPNPPRLRPGQTKNGAHCVGGNPPPKSVLGQQRKSATAARMSAPG